MTSCSWLRMGWRASALRNLARPRRRFSIKAPSFDRWLPLTGVASAEDQGHTSGPAYSPATLFGGRSGSTLNGYRLCRQSSSQTKSLYRRTTLPPLLELVTS